MEPFAGALGNLRKEERNKWGFLGSVSCKGGNRLCRKFLESIFLSVPNFAPELKKN
jgi:hypothetical protein